MKSNKNARQTLGTILRDDREGTSHAEIAKMLDQELNKGEAMDADLIVEAFQDTALKQPALDMETNWALIESAIDQRERTAAPRKRRTGWALRVAAVWLAFTMIAVGTVATKAWRWDSLIEIVQPMLLTLGIHINVKDLSIVGDVEHSEAMVDAVSRTLMQESEVPDKVRGIAARPAWIPKGYAFFSAQSYEDPNESSLMISYRKDGSELFVQTVVYTQDDTLTAVNVLVKDDKGTEVTQGITVTENDGVVCATFQDNLAYYMVWGRLSRADILSVITSIS